MPGISLACDPRKGLLHKEIVLSQSLDSLLHTYLYEKRIILNNPFCFLGTTQYKGYPSELLDSPDFAIYIEGQIYEKNPALVNHRVISSSK